MTTPPTLPPPTPPPPALPSGTPSSRTPMSHRDAWETIPWHVNGSLAADESARLAAHAETCAACRAEIAAQAALRRIVRELDHEAASARPWPRAGKLRSAIGAGRFPWPMIGTGRVFWPAIGAGGAALTALVLVAALPQGDGFRTLTADPEAVPADKVELRLRPVAGADPEAVRAAIAAVGAVPSDMGSPNGVIRATVAAEARDAALAVLRADPLFLVVAGD